MPDLPRVTVSFPARPEYLRLARLATADVCSRAGFDYEEIDDLRIAVSELCSLVEAPSTAILTLELTYEDGTVSVAGLATPGKVVSNDLSTAIISAVVEDYEFHNEAEVARFRASKRTRTNGP